MCTSHRRQVGRVWLAGRMQSTATTEKVCRNYFHCLHAQWSAFSSDFLCFSIHTNMCKLLPLVRVCACVCLHVPSVNCFSYFYKTTLCIAPYIYFSLKSNILVFEKLCACVCCAFEWFQTIRCNVQWMLKVKLLNYNQLLKWLVKIST